MFFMCAEQFEKKVPVDKKIEAMPRMAEVAAEENNILENQPVSTSAVYEPQNLPQEKDEELLIIENILSEDIYDIYAQLSAIKQQAFKKKGEETAVKIKNILKQTSVKIHEVFELIKEWLKTLPKISIYFLEQEAKIKTDKVLQLKKEGQEIEK